MYIFSCWGLSLMTSLLKIFPLGSVMTVLLITDLQTYYMRALLSGQLTQHEWHPFINSHINTEIKDHFILPTLTPIRSGFKNKKDKF